VLGIDPLSRDFTSSRFTQLLAGSKRPLKDFLLDQTRVAGIGNLLLRIAMARSPRPSPPRQHLEPAGGAPAAQSNCVRSRACLRMLSAPGTRLSRPGLVVPGVGKYSSRLWPRGKTLPPLRSADPAHCTGRPVDLLVRALSAIGAFKG
jgi:formamidopyrimidine-DNA glycosylase